MKQVTWVGEGDGDAGGGGAAVDCAGAGEDAGALVGAVDGCADRVAGAEAADRVGFGAVLDGAEAAAEPGFTSSLKPLSVNDGVGDADPAPAPAPLEVGNEAAAAPVAGAPSPPEEVRLSKQKKQRTTTAAHTPATLKLKPRRFFCERRPRWSPSAACPEASAPPRKPEPVAAWERPAAWDVAATASVGAAATACLAARPPSIWSPRARPRRPPPDPTAAPLAEGCPGSGRSTRLVIGRSAGGCAGASRIGAGCGCSRARPGVRGVHGVEDGSRTGGAAAAPWAPQPGQDTAPLRCLRQYLQ
jgi:hypothetical protein